MGNHPDGLEAAQIHPTAEPKLKQWLTSPLQIDRHRYGFVPNLSTRCMGPCHAWEKRGGMGMGNTGVEMLTEKGRKLGQGHQEV